MQMRASYETTNKKLRASRLRKEGRELARAGFQDSANQNFELAAYIDPPTPEVEESENESDSGSNNRGVVRSSSGVARKGVSQSRQGRLQNTTLHGKQPAREGARRAA